MKKEPSNFQIVYSIKKMGTFISIFCVAVSILITISISIYLNRTFRSQLYENSVDTLALHERSVLKQLQGVETYLFELSSFNTDIAQLNVATSSSSVYISVNRVQQLFETTLMAFDSVDGMFYYSPACDQYIYAGTSGVIELHNYNRTLLRENKEDLFHGAIDFTGWHLFEDSKNTYLIRYMICDSSVAGAWVSLSNLTSVFEAAFGSGSYVFFADENGQLINASDFESFQMDQKEATHTYQIYQAADGTEYLAASLQLDYFNGYLVAFLPTEDISQSLIPVMRSNIAIVLLIVALFNLIYLLYRRLMFSPIRSIESMISVAHTGQTPHYQPQSVLQCKEINEVNTVFQNLIQEIQQLKIEKYEKELSSAKIEILYLRSQFSPHFLINCLSTITSIAMDTNMPGSRELLTQMSRTLSEHLRYTLANQQHVSLEKEIYYTRNYHELTALRYPGCLKTSIHIPEAVKNATVFPMMLLQLTENSIKHNMIMGEPLEIFITAELISNGDEQRIHICHIDTGSGYPEEDLDFLNHIYEHPEVCREGNHVGIYSTVKYFHLAYGENASVLFSNEPGKGARIDYDIPFQMDTEES